MKIIVISILLLFVILANWGFASAIRINEVELNPAGSDSGNEWIEVYSPQETSIDGWSIENVKGKQIGLNGSFSDFKVIMTPYNFLTNDKQKLILYDDSKNRVDETDVISDTSNDDRSWQYCGDGWVFFIASKEEENNCKDVSENSTKEDKQVTVKNSKISGAAVQDTINHQENATSINGDNLDKTTPEVVSSEPIKLESKSIKTWKSRTRYIKEYSLAGFTLFCLVTLTVLLIKNGRKNKIGDDF